MIISNHDRGCHALANQAAVVVHHCEVDIKPDLLSVMPAITSDSNGKHDRPGRKIKHVRAIELNDARRVFLDAS